LKSDQKAINSSIESYFDTFLQLKLFVKQDMKWFITKQDFKTV